MLAAEFASFQFKCVQGTAVFYIYISMSSVASEDNFPSVYGRPNFATAQLFCLASFRTRTLLPFFSFEFGAEEPRIKLVRPFQIDDKLRHPTDEHTHLTCAATPFEEALNSQI